MYYSLFEVFSIGIGPSSSHTVGPMRAANRYLNNLIKIQALQKVKKLKVTLFGSLALTGVGHGTVNAVVYGLMGLKADSIDLSIPYVELVHQSKKLSLNSSHEIDFKLNEDIVFKEEFLPEHANALQFEAWNETGRILLQETYFSVGGGTIARHDEIARRVERAPFDVPYPFDTCRELIDICQKNDMTISEVVMANEVALRSEGEVKAGIARINDIMQNAIERGIHTEGVLPGGLNVKRRAGAIYERLEQKFRHNDMDPLMIIDWINLWGFAVAEENAAGGQIVTAPTMGSAGVIPAVMRYYQRFATNKSPFDVEMGNLVFLTTASAICSLYRTNASISGAEVGCQGEIGVACSMAAGGLAAAMGGSRRQIENAAEIGMEHNLGLTCDPIAGLVQVPCIERNAMGAVKAVNAARLAMRGTGEHLVSLDSVIKTMYETGLHLNSMYKETSLGGLAVNTLTC